MRRIYLYLGFALCALSFWLGYTIGTPSLKNIDQDLSVLKRKYDSISGEQAASRRKEAEFKQQAYNDSIEVEAYKREMAYRERNHSKTQKQYGIKIKAVENYSLDELDSFLIDMYPRPGIRKLRYNEDGSPRTEVETENDGADGNPVRLTDERIRQTVQGQLHIETYCGEAESRIIDEGWTIDREGGSIIKLRETEVVYSAGSRSLEEEGHDLQGAADFSFVSHYSIGDWGAGTPLP